jgi:hypothetical protein
VTVFVFIAGLVLGFYIELSNVNKSDLLIRSSETDLLDQQIKLSGLNEDINFNCEIAKANIFKFADEIYSEVVKLEEQDGQSKFTVDQMRILHKRYDLLRINLWLQALKVKNRCNESFHTVLYFFDYASTDVDIRSEQRVFSLVLLDLKYNHPNEILLLPIAANLNLDSVDMIRGNYNVFDSPSVIIDESMVVDSLVTLEELEQSIFGSSDSENVIILKP